MSHWSLSLNQSRFQAPKVPSCLAATETGSASHKDQVSCVSPELSLSGMRLASPGTWLYGLPGTPQILRYLVSCIHCNLVEQKSYLWKVGWEQQRPKSSFSVVLSPPHIHTPATISHGQLNAARRPHILKPPSGPGAGATQEHSASSEPGVPALLTCHHPPSSTPSPPAPQAHRHTSRVVTFL